MKVIQNHEPSNMRCGEYAAWMILDHLGIPATFNEIQEAMGTANLPGSQHNHLIALLTKYNVSFRDYTEETEAASHPTAVANPLIMTYADNKHHPAVFSEANDGSGGHWTIYFQGNVYDSVLNHPVSGLEAYINLWLPPNAENNRVKRRITNFIEILSQPKS